VRLQKHSALLLAPFLVAILSVTASAQTFPKPTGRVNDFANVIDASTEAEIDRQLDLLEQNTTSEIAVATVKSLDDMSVEEYGNRLFKAWGVGQGKQDNGVLVLVAPSERKMRIEVGYGLEGVLPDGLAGQVIRDDFTPSFKNGDYSGGIRTGVTHLVQIVEKHQVLTPAEIAKLQQSRSSEANAPLWIVLPFFSVFVTIGFVMLGAGVRTKTGFGLLFGSLFGGMPLLMSLAFAGRMSLFTLFPLAAGMFVAGWRLGGRQSWQEAFRNPGGGKGGKRGGSSSGWTMGGGSSSGGSSSSSSSSSSFGGGSSGGGGASGSW
jgi:uncharacterized protein